MIDGQEYRINQKMVRVEKRGWLEWFFYKGLSKYIGVPFLTIIAPILFVLASTFSWAREILSTITWIFTPWLDKALVDVKQELLKDAKGKRVLDIHPGGGDWLNYLTGAAMVTELEPHRHRLNFTSKAVDQFRKNNPTVNIELIDRPIEEFHPGVPYDVSEIVCRNDGIRLTWLLDGHSRECIVRGTKYNGILATRGSSASPWWQGDLPRAHPPAPRDPSRNCPGYIRLVVEGGKRRMRAQ